MGFRWLLGVGGGRNQGTEERKSQTEKEKLSLREIDGEDREAERQRGRDRGGHRPAQRLPAALSPPLSPRGSVLSRRGFNLTCCDYPAYFIVCQSSTRLEIA